MEIEEVIEAKEVEDGKNKTLPVHLCLADFSVPPRPSLPPRPTFLLLRRKVFSLWLSARLAVSGANMAVAAILAAPTTRPSGNAANSNFGLPHDLSGVSM